MKRSIYSLTILTGLTFLLGIMGAAAQSTITNFITFKLAAQYAGIVSTNGSVITAVPATVKITNKEILNFLAYDYHAAGHYDGTNFPAGAKLAIIDEKFYVLAADNSVILDVSETLSMDTGSESVKLGKFNQDTGLAAPSSTELGRVKFIFDDTGVTNSSNLAFEMEGLLKSTYTDSAPTGNIYTETQKHTVSPLVGDGHKAGNYFTITGSASASGKGSLSVTP